MLHTLHDVLDARYMRTNALGEPTAQELERLLEEISFEASDLDAKDAKILIDAAYVDKFLGELSQNEDLSRFIL